MPDGSALDEAFCLAGASISNETSCELESSLSADESNLAVRLQLLGYFYDQMDSKSVATRRHQHVIWMIRNRPQYYISGTPWVTWFQRMPKLQSESLLEWDKQVKLNEHDVSILGNCAFHYQLDFPKVARELYLRCLELDPENNRWPNLIDRLDRVIEQSGP